MRINNPSFKLRERLKELIDYLLTIFLGTLVCRNNNSLSMKNLVNYSSSALEIVEFNT